MSLKKTGLLPIHIRSTFKIPFQWQQYKEAHSIEAKHLVKVRLCLHCAKTWKRLISFSFFINSCVSSLSITSRNRSSCLFFRQGFLGFQRTTMTIEPMDLLRSYLSRVRIPEPTNRIYKHECCISFDSPVMFFFFRIVLEMINFCLNQLRVVLPLF